MGKNTGKVREFCQSGKVGTLTVNRPQQQKYHHLLYFIVFIQCLLKLRCFIIDLVKMKDVQFINESNFFRWRKHVVYVKFLWLLVESFVEIEWRVYYYVIVMAYIVLFYFQTRNAPTNYWIKLKVPFGRSDIQETIPIFSISKILHTS